MELESAAFLPPSMMGERAPAACPAPLCAGLAQLLNTCSHRIYSSNPFYAFPVPIVFMVALSLVAECRLPALIAGQIPCSTAQPWSSLYWLGVRCWCGSWMLQGTGNCQSSL